VAHPPTDCVVVANPSADKEARVVVGYPTDSEAHSEMEDTEADSITHSSSQSIPSS